MSDNEIILWDCDRDCTSEGVRYKLARCWSTCLLKVIALDANSHENDFNFTFVKNSKGETYTFFNREFAIEKLNEWFPPKKIDPDYHIVLSSDDDVDTEDDDDLIIDINQ